jgi:hypothetical protein
MTESTWRHVKVFLNPYNWMVDYINHLANYMFAVWCQSDNMDHFTKFIGIIATVDSSATPPLNCGHVVV